MSRRFLAGVRASAAQVRATYDGGRRVTVLLAIDCSGEQAMVALAREGEVLAERTIGGRRSSEELLPAVRAVLAEAGVGAGAVTVVGVVRGPGSFTGVRVGLAAAKGLSEGLGVPLVAVSRFAVVAGAAGAPEALVLLAAGRGEWFWGWVREGRDGEQGLGGWDAAREELQEGTQVVCLEEDAAAWEGCTVVRHAGAEAVADVLWQAWRAGAQETELLDALYLRRTEAELLERQRLHREAAGQQV